MSAQPTPEEIIAGLKAEISTADDAIRQAKNARQDIEYKILGEKFIEVCGDDKTKLTAAIDLLTSYRDALP